VQWTFFKNTKNSITFRPHAVLWKIKIHSKSLPTKPYTLEQPQGMSENRTPHGRHASRICIYVSTIPILLTPHSSLTLPTTSRAQTQQITSMPATRTHAQRSSVPYAYSSSSSESSVLNQCTPSPYIHIPKISLLDYGKLLSDEETFDKVMATIGH
jgi:hypothetical protein